MRRSSHGLLPIVLLLAACNGDVLTLRYHLDEVDAAKVARVQTTLLPPSPERFLAASGEVVLDERTSYRVDCGGCGDACLEDCALQMLLETRPRTGEALPRTFSIEFRGNEAGTPRRLLVSAVAPDEDGVVLGRTSTIESPFGGATIDLYLRAGALCGAQVCLPTESCCDGACIDVAADDRNCGSCGAVCGDGETCDDKACRCGAEPSCTGGKQCCPGTGCVDITKDPRACGGCGKACPIGESCVDQKCGCGPAGTEVCDPLTQYCCGSGGCTANGTLCACPGAPKPCASAEETCCGSECVLLDSQNNHCGSCANQCMGGTSCQEGSCSCGVGPCSATCCTGDCTNLVDDRKHCGGCDIACRDDEACKAGSCVCGAAPCGPGQRCCAGVCTPSASACGGCGEVCAIGETCQDDECVCVGATGATVCAAGQACCGGVCANTMTDRDHCGSGCLQCPPNNICVGGVCTLTSCDPTCVTNQNTCTDGVCSCNGGAACTGTEYCCGMSCKRTDTVNNCGSCAACKANESCVNRTCVCPGAGDMPCPSNQTCCTNGCQNLANDELNCGGCGVVCGFGETCTNGQCTCYNVPAPPSGPVCNPSTRYCDHVAKACVAFGSVSCPVTGWAGIDCNAGGGATQVCCGRCFTPLCKKFVNCTGANGCIPFM